MKKTALRDIVERVLAQQAACRRPGWRAWKSLWSTTAREDQTAAVVRGLMAANSTRTALARVRLMQHEHNRGYGAALKTGLAQAEGDLIAFLDADGTYPPEYFPQLCEQVLGGRRRGHWLAHVGAGERNAIHPAGGQPGICAGWSPGWATNACATAPAACASFGASGSSSFIRCPTA